MLEVPEHRRILLREVRRTQQMLREARGEHHRAVRQERMELASARSHLREQRRQHRLILDQVRSRLADDRHYHRRALAANRWLLALVDFLLPRWQSPALRRRAPAPRVQIQPAPDGKSGGGPMGRPLRAPYPGAG
jgi:hypothetical protein